jgi:hypothetical protein
VARMARSAVRRLAEQVVAEARVRAPAAKAWITHQDERVRPAHADADGQTIPANLRFKLRKQIYVRGAGRGHHGPGHTVLAEGGFDLARAPRDESLPADQAINCRCQSVEIRGLIASKIRVGLTSVQGTRVTAQVSVRFNRIVESEHGTSGDRAAHFMGGALNAVAARTRAASRRT